VPLAEPPVVAEADPKLKPVDLVSAPFAGLARKLKAFAASTLVDVKPPNPANTFFF